MESARNDVSPVKLVSQDNVYIPQAPKKPKRQRTEQEIKAKELARELTAPNGGLVRPTFYHVLARRRLTYGLPEKVIRKTFYLNRAPTPGKIQRTTRTQQRITHEQQTNPNLRRRLIFQNDMDINNNSLS